ncbi:unnamed protein product, partial [Didymodactylos carnosus]
QVTNNLQLYVKKQNETYSKQQDHHFKYLQSKYYSVQCTLLYEDDQDEIKHALTLLSNKTYLKLIDDKYYNITKEQCKNYKLQRFNYPYHINDEQNKNFPIAFTILMHEHVEVFERLLRMIYRPQNYYCIHVDNGTSVDVYNGVKNIVQCFDNVILVSKREQVVYATFSRLQADINCMNDLFKYPHWKYLLNMANTELPLKTNNELVKILKIYRGFNDIEGRWKTRNPHRTQYRWETIPTGNTDQQLTIKKTDRMKKPPPSHIEIVKGSAYGAFSRQFVEFVLTSSIAKELLEWSRDTYSPDEHYWSSLNFNTHIHAPGSYKAKDDPTKWTARFVNWGDRNCNGTIVRGICVLSTVDLALLANRRELFANKFSLNRDPIVYQCLEELIMNKSLVDLPLSDASYY